MLMKMSLRRKSMGMVTEMETEMRLMVDNPLICLPFRREMVYTNELVDSRMGIYIQL